MHELTSLDDLACALGGARKRIGIDGRHGVRKTSVATFLSGQLGIQTVHVDDYLVKNEGGYVDFVRYDELEQVLSSREIYIVDGVCLLHVLEKVRAEIDTLVYVKRYHLGLWADERELEVPQEELESFLEKEREFSEMLSGEKDSGGPSMAEDVVRYHSHYRPQARAHFVYRWDDL